MTFRSAPIVIGSGPSGIAITATLIQAGLRPIVLDGGILPEGFAQRQQSASRALLSCGIQPVGSPTPLVGSHKKSWFGSTSALDQEQLTGDIAYAPHIEARTSSGVGGLSRLWGGTFDFYRSLPSWPERFRPSLDDINLVETLVPNSYTIWETEINRPTQGGISGAETSRLALERFKRSIEGERWSIQASRLAIDSRAESTSACVKCGLCIDGCPQDSIWFAGDTLKSWTERGLIEHRPGFLAVAVRETPRGVDVTVTRDMGTEILQTQRVFIAAGPISTARLLIKSGLMSEVTIQDSAVAFSGLLSLHRESPPWNSHALSQWWIRSYDSSFAAQVYAPNVSHLSRLRSRFPSFPGTSLVLSGINRRLHPLITYLDSSLSDTLQVSRHGQKVLVTASTSQQTRRRMQGYLRQLSRNFLKAGYLLPVSMSEFGGPGAGFHSGASLPPGSVSDSLGRIDGLSRIHVVDASVLPHIEVGSITPTVMANAIRIGRAVVNFPESMLA